ncbi:MAG: sulfotransferase domain-containing protein [Gammaproteobacteria bacterium]
MKQNIVFISGIPRSGTSLLHLMIGAHPRYVSVGEVYGLIRPGSERFANPEGVQCSCGKTANDCTFWGEVVSRLRGSDEATAAGRYQIFLDVFKARFGDDKAPVDSSKAMPALAALTTLPHVQVKTFYVIKDVRAWTVSLREHQNQQFRKLPRYQRFTRNMSSRLFRRWYRENRENQAVIKRLGVPSAQLSYEELCLFPSQSLTKISAFLGDEFTAEVLSFNKAEHHGVLINRMRNSEEKMSGVFYDIRWLFSHKQWRVPMLLFPRIMDYNNRHVYGHVATPYKQPGADQITVQSEGAAG